MYSTLSLSKPETKIKKNSRKYRPNGCKQKVNKSDSDGNYPNRQLFGSI